MAGSDLDGDLYFVTWHEELILKKENESPMHFPKAVESHLDGPVTESDIIQQLKFIVESDNKGRISRQHLKFADKKGIFSEECKSLADLSAQMYDAPKTGVVPEWPSELRTKESPDFLEKDDHRESYKSERVLGRLHRHSKLMLETVTELSKDTRGASWNSNSSGSAGDHCNVVAADSVAEMANTLQESYRQVMQNLSQTYNIQTEMNIWRARLPNFRNTEAEKQNRTQLIQDFHLLHQTMQRQYTSAVRQLQKRETRENEIRHQLYCQCKQLRSKPYCAGFSSILRDGKRKNMSAEADQVDQECSVYTQVGRKILQSLALASRCRLVTSDCIQHLVDQSQKNKCIQCAY